jgi:integrase
MSTTITIEDPMAKRKYGQGSIRKRGNSWWIAFRPEKGADQVWERVGSEADGVTEAVAEHALMEKLVIVGRGQGSQFKGYPFQRFAQDWRQRVEINGNKSARTLELYDNALQVHLFPAFGDEYLHQIDHTAIEDYIQAKLSKIPGEPGAVPVEGEVALNLGRPVGRRTVEQHLSVLNMIYREAIKQGKVINNPVEKVDFAADNPDDKEPLEKEEVKALLQACPTEEQETLILLMVSTGLRIGELFGLQIKDYDPKDKTLHIQRTLTRRKGSTIISQKPKTKAGNRFLPLSDHLAMRLERQIARAKITCKQEKIKPIFPNTVGRIQPTTNFRNRQWKPALQHAGLPDYQPHQLRHTFVSETLASRPNMPITQLSYLLGHSNPAITYSIYSKMLKRYKTDVADIASVYYEEED